MQPVAEIVSVILIDPVVPLPQVTETDGLVDEPEIDPPVADHW